MALVVLSTAPNKKEAKRLAKKLCKRRLAACVQTHKIQSYYHWQGAICAESEIALSIKTRKKHYKKICKFLRSHHSYEVPQILAFTPYKIEKHYKKWLKSHSLKN